MSMATHEHGNTRAWQQSSLIKRDHPVSTYCHDSSLFIGVVCGPEEVSTEGDIAGLVRLLHEAGGGEGTLGAQSLMVLLPETT